MKRLIISVLMLMVATFIFSQGNKSDDQDKNANQELVTVEQGVSKTNKL
jgi:hypothetical protein